MSNNMYLLSNPFKKESRKVISRSSDRDRDSIINRSLSDQSRHGRAESAMKNIERLESEIYREEKKKSSINDCNENFSKAEKFN